MRASIIGLGMVSPAGARVRDHVFYPRAEAPAPSGSPFVFADGRRYDVRRCPWIGPLEDATARMKALATAALNEALSTVPEALRRDCSLHLVLPDARDGVTLESLGALRDDLARTVSAADVHGYRGAAGCHRALEQISERIGSGHVERVLLCAVDSFVSAADAAAWLARPPSPWLTSPAIPSEGASALFIASDEVVSRHRLDPLGKIHASKSALGKGTDNDDEPLDGAAMSTLLAGIANRQVGAVFGQNRVDHLRLCEWERVVARNASRFDPTYQCATLESDIGRVGSAAGAMNLAYGIAMLHHRALAPEPPRGSVLSWAISRDGTRGLCELEVSREHELTATWGDLVGRVVTHDPFVPPAASEPSELDEDIDEQLTLLELSLEEQQCLFSEFGSALDDEHTHAPAAPPLGAMPPRLLKNHDEPLVRIDESRAEPIALGQFYQDVVCYTAETSAMLTQDRAEGPWLRAPDAERRLRCQLDAVVATGGSALSTIVDWWSDRPQNPWVSYAALLLLLGFEREDAIDAAHAGCEALDDGEIGAVVAAGEALSLSRHSGLAALATALSVSESPAAQAIGLSALSAAGGVAAELIAQLLDDDRAVVRRAAVWCCERAPIDARKKLIYPLQRSLDREECWPAARQLAVWGDPSGLARIDALGWRGVDMLTLCGTSTDLMHIDGILKRCERSPALLESVGRLGSPRAIDWLLRQLASGELAEHAARALAVMLGPIVAERDARLDASAWRAAIALLELDGDRYRGGSVWSAAAVADECERGVAAGELSRIDLERRCDELRARLGTPNEQTLDAIDLWRWHAAADQQLAGFLAAARTAGA